jgi:hypothetical protein
MDIVARKKARVGKNYLTGDFKLRIMCCAIVTAVLY